MESTIADPGGVIEVLQNHYAAYLQVSAPVLMVHDWLILLDREIEHVWRAKWNVGKVLYIVTRYGAFVDVPTKVILQTAPFGATNYSACRMLYQISTLSLAFGMSISESILILRTCAIYSRSKRISVPLSVAYAVGVVAAATISWRGARTVVFGPPPSDLFVGCTAVQATKGFPIGYALLVLFELVVVIMTVRRGFRDFSSGTPLLRVLYRDSIFFFLVLFGVTVFTIFVLELAPFQYNGPMTAYARVTHSIVCCRILLNLKQASKPKCNETVLLASLAFVTPPGQRGGQSELVPSLGTHDARDNEED